MYEIRTTEIFDKWLNKLRDSNAILSMTRRFAKIETDGHFGDHKQLSENLWELRIFVGKGYRVYYTIRGNEIVLLLCGGDKSNKKGQNADITKAQGMIENLEDNDDD